MLNADASGDVFAVTAATDVDDAAAVVVTDADIVIQDPAVQTGWTLFAGRFKNDTTGTV